MVVLGVGNCWKCCGGPGGVLVEVPLVSGLCGDSGLRQCVYSRGVGLTSSAQGPSSGVFAWLSPQATVPRQFVASSLMTPES